jgi:hypothetical protein
MTSEAFHWITTIRGNTHGDARPVRMATIWRMLKLSVDTNVCIDYSRVRTHGHTLRPTALVHEAHLKSA